MRIFNWKLNKLNGKHSSKKHELVSSSASYFVKKECDKEEFIEWPHGLLAIGTIGDVNWKKNPDEESQDPKPDTENEVNLLCHETGKDMSFHSTKNGDISKTKSLSFLLKKMIACRSGFPPPAPSLKDPVSESQLEKIMRAIFHKKMKIYPQSSGTTLFTKKYLKNRSVKESISTDEVLEDDVNETENGCKWVKTDSEYIVLEM